MFDDYLEADASTPVAVEGIRLALNKLSKTNAHSYKNGHMSDAAEAFEVRLFAKTCMTITRTCVCELCYIPSSFIVPIVQTILRGLALVSPQAAAVFELKIQEVHIRLVLLVFVV
jgi:hypothetical protein